MFFLSAAHDAFAARGGHGRAGFSLPPKAKREKVLVFVFFFVFFFVFVLAMFVQQKQHLLFLFDPLKKVYLMFTCMLQFCDIMHYNV